MNAVGVLDAFTRMITGGRSGKIVTRRFDGASTVSWSFNESSEDSLDHKSIEALWRSQPHLRTVVNFLARNIAQLGLHTFKANGESNERMRGDDVSKVIARPNGRQTRYDLIYSLVGDFALYDKSYLWCTVDMNRSEGYSLYCIPAGWVESKTNSFYGATDFVVTVPGEDTESFSVPGSEIVEFEGWTPGDPTSPTSPVETLRLTLEEQHHARVHRKQLWKKNGRIGSFVTRPKDAPQWDGAARKRFMDMLEAFTGDKGSRAGGMPMLEDGMDVKRVGFSSADEQWADSTKLSLATVAQVYHVNPTMIGLLDNANYSNVREFRRGLYGDTLGPIIAMLESRLNEFLLPMLDAPEGVFLEFNVEAKLRGSFEEQAAVISASVGGPWMTRNEARRLQNLPAIDGGDVLIVPLNLGTPDAGEADPDEVPPDTEKVAEVWRKCLVRQQSVVPTNGWDADRWNRELGADLATIGVPDAVKLANDLNIHTKSRLDADLDNPGHVFNLLILEVPQWQKSRQQ